VDERCPSLEIRWKNRLLIQTECHCFSKFISLDNAQSRITLPLHVMTLISLLISSLSIFVAFTIPL
jgi:hypothetical protein